MVDKYNLKGVTPNTPDRRPVDDDGNVRDTTNPKPDEPAPPPSEPTTTPPTQPPPPEPEPDDDSEDDDDVSPRRDASTGD